MMLEIDGDELIGQDGGNKISKKRYKNTKHKSRYRLKKGRERIAIRYLDARETRMQHTQSILIWLARP